MVFKKLLSYVRQGWIEVFRIENNSIVLIVLENALMKWWRKFIRVDLNLSNLRISQGQLGMTILSECNFSTTLFEKNNLIQTPKNTWRKIHIGLESNFIKTLTIDSTPI